MSILLLLAIILGATSTLFAQSGNLDGTFSDPVLRNLLTSCIQSKIGIAECKARVISADQNETILIPGCHTCDCGGDCGDKFITIRPDSTHILTKFLSRLDQNQLSIFPFSRYKGVLKQIDNHTLTSEIIRIHPELGTLFSTGLCNRTNHLCSCEAHPRFLFETHECIIS